ncbi:efflux RND transporter periplasmic adaptor subunit [Herbaspirillum sp. HC18]|nr:efflux RND transporter periplasmic adaptor subunit [Herbaspirillum sp. HC18]
MFRKTLFSLTIAAALLQTASPLQAEDGLRTVTVRSGGATGAEAFDGVVEAVRQTVLSVQVPGAVVMLAVKAGDTVKEGQALLRIDARAALQASAASDAQAQAARSALDLAAKDYQRQQQLFQKQYISQAAMDRAEAQFRATSAQLNAQIAQASAARIQSDFFVVRAPYSGVVSDVPVAMGDMATPGRALLTIYDPAVLRVTASVPQAALTRIAVNEPVKIELPSLSSEQRWMTRPQMQVLPTFDAGTHSVQVRVALPSGATEMMPGMFARVWLPTRGGTAAKLFVPASAVVRRTEMTGLYVIGRNGRPGLRQVRLGRTQDDMVEVLAGVASGEHIALDPQLAAGMR